MTAHKNHNNLRNLSLLAGACSALGATLAHAAVSFEPRIGANLTWTDNVELAPPGAEKRDSLIAQALPGFRLTVDGTRWQAYADYELQAMYFQDDDDKNSVFHKASLGSQLAVLPDWFFIDAAASRNQTVVDPTAPTSIDNIFQVGNTADATSGQITPILQHAFRFAEIEATYTRGFVDYSEAADTTDLSSFAIDDSKNESSSFSLRSPEGEERITWGTSYRRDKVDYDLGLTYKYEQALGEIGLRVAPSLQLLANAGVESDPRNDLDDGGLDEKSYQGGFSWRPTLGTELRLMAGHRFFGTTYDGSARYTGRVVEADVEYHESPTTQTQSYALRSVIAPGDFPVGLDPTFSRTTADVYLLKALSGRIGVRGRITDIFVGFTSERRQYFTVPSGEDEYRGATVQATRRLGPRMQLEGLAGIEDAKLREGADYREHTFSISLVRQIGTTTELALSLNHDDRDGDREYRTNWVMLGVQMVFGNKGGALGSNTGGRRSMLPGRSTLPTLPGRR